MSELSPKERQAKVKQMRESGMTFKQIGLQMGFGVERARQLYVKATRRDRRENEVSSLYFLNGEEGINIRRHVSARTFDVLRRMGIETIMQLKNLDELTIWNTRQVGQKTYDEIMWLKKVKL